jgi:hypothetical protein
MNRHSFPTIQMERKFSFVMGRFISSVSRRLKRLFSASHHATVVNLSAQGPDFDLLAGRIFSREPSQTIHCDGFVVIQKNVRFQR